MKNRKNIKKIYVKTSNGYIMYKICIIITKIKSLNILKTSNEYNIYKK